MAEQIEAIEAQGWRMDQFTSVPYADNMTTVCLFRRVKQERPIPGLAAT